LLTGFFFCDRLGDQLPVEAAVFDEDFVGVHPGNDYAG
jgi:hypothetical protein